MTIALWCVLLAILQPYICFGIAVNRSRLRGKKMRDNRSPRDFPNRLEGLPKRAWNAQLNAFESLPGFAAAVIIAELVHAHQVRIDMLALLWVAARLAYVIFYLGDKSTLRSSAQFVSMACVLGLFVVAALGQSAGSHLGFAFS
ncbi:MAG: MAPEG family protein [Rhodanobacteraceae bacterium]